MTRDDRIKALWSEMDADQRARAWAGMGESARVDAVRAMFDATEITASDPRCDGVERV